MAKISRFLIHWLSTLLALWVVDSVFDSLAFDTVEALVVSSLVLSVVNLTIKPLLMLVTLPLTVLSLGLAIPLINGAVLLVIAAIIPGFFISGFWMGVACALAISFVSFLIGIATGQSLVRGQVSTRSGFQERAVVDERVIDVEVTEKRDRSKDGSN